MPRLTLDGRTIAYDDVGSGPPLVLVHGHPFNRSMWAPQAREFRASHRVIVPDLRGYGATTVTPGTVTLGDHARDIAALLDALDLGPVALGGLSMGGQIVLECYAQFPDRIRALLLCDTFASLDTPDGRRLRIATAERLEREGMAGYAAEVLPKMIGPATAREQPAVAGQVLAMMEATPPAGAAASLRGRSQRPDYLPLLPAISVPALVVVGEDDAFTPISDARIIQGAIPGAALEIIPRAGHMPNLEQPARFNRVVGDWLAGLFPPADRQAQ